MNVSLLDYRLDSNIDLQLANPIRRLLNWCIDVASFIAIIGATSFVLQIQFALLAMTSTLIGKLFFIVLIVIYFFVIEFIMNGQSIGKYLTKTKVVNHIGYPPDLSAYLIRSLFRMIPLTGISLFFSGKKTLFDNLSNTIVIDNERSKL